MTNQKEFPAMLRRIYESRAKGSWNITTTEELLLLADKSERELYFFLTYAYMSDMDLSRILNADNLTVRLIISLYTKIAVEYGYSCIAEYYRKFVVVNESSKQVDNVIHEIQMAEVRDCFYDR